MSLQTATFETIKSIFRLTGTSNSLRRKTIVGTQWYLLRSTIVSCLDLIKTAIFARILFPDDYGMIALAMLPIGLLGSFSKIGVEILIQREGDEYRERIASYWTVQFLRGFFLFTLAWFAATPLAAYYQNGELIPVIRFLGIIFLTEGIAGFGREIRQREMQFQRVAIVDSIIAVVVLLIGLFFLFHFRNYWALAIYAVINSFFIMITSYVLYPWKPKIELNKSILKGLFAFSTSIILINILNYFFNNFDKAIIGKILGLEQLGIYARAYFLALIPVSHVFNAMAPVILNAFRKAADDPLRMRAAFMKCAGGYCALALVIGAFFLLFAHSVISILYGEKWLAVVPIFKILVLYGITKGITTLCPPIIFIKNKPWLITLVALIMVCVFSILAVPMTKMFGVQGTAWAVVIAGSISNGTAFVIVHRLLFSIIREDESLPK